MDNTELDSRLGKYRFDGFGKTSQPINTGNENILDAPILEFGDDRKSEFGGIILGHPYP
jgi:hypothetical protein